MKNVVLVFLCINVVFGGRDVPKVTLKHGTISGKYQQTIKGRAFSAFYGIPYAKPPVGELRFKSPVPIEPWHGNLDASTLAPICPQRDYLSENSSVIGNEDCLYLNIYTPRLFNSTASGNLPVIFFVHGGSFLALSSNPNLYGPDILLDKNVVFVTTNYRIGAFGFLSTEDEFLPGNYGLKDQSLALRWVKENIAPFGGDPNKITLFGQSAGAVAVHYLMLSDLSKHLISGAISLSGVSVARWALAAEGEAATNAKRLASYVNCSQDSIPDMVKCLRGVDASDIIRQEKRFEKWSNDPLIPFKPVIEPNKEGAFLTENPADVIKSGKSANVPLIIGVVLQDGGAKAASLFKTSNLIPELNEDFDKLLPVLMFLDNVDMRNVTGKIRNFYFGEKPIDNSTKFDLIDLFSDIWYFRPANVAAMLHAKFTKQPVYSLMFGYRGTLSWSKLVGDPTQYFGVCHGDELFYLLSQELFPNYQPSESDLKMNDVMTTLLENFAATGNPTPNVDRVVPTKWDPVQSSGSPSYYFIKKYDDIAMAANLLKERDDFWRGLHLDGHSPVKNEV